MTAFVAWLTAFLVVGGGGLVATLILAPARSPRAVGWAGAGAGIALIGLGATAMLQPSPVAITLWTIPGLAAVVIRGDALSGVFIIITGLVVLPASIFAAGRLPHIVGHYAVRAFGVMYFVLLASIAWVLLAADVFSFFLAWEIMSILCYL
ncbi:MAG: hypothetical protein ACREN3_14650, partial [Gemmatimonadaceae bacterium]